MTRGALLILCLSALVGCGPPLVDKVPDKGALRQGQQVIVTDDSCPPSEMKLVTGGGFGQSNEVECVPKFR
ncbi:DUF6719 family protein [Rhizobium viscosum]|uniref:Lipoprotein n=1 Tax=Rhizobium viscosum TaxID=1673 RepID=A0ABR9IZP8_RHIVS|nr:hypothetical protein [Rhizobium viscosum]